MLQNLILKILPLWLIRLAIEYWENTEVRFSNPNGGDTNKVRCYYVTMDKRKEKFHILGMVFDSGKIITTLLQRSNVQIGNKAGTKPHERVIKIYFMQEPLIFIYRMELEKCAVDNNCCHCHSKPMKWRYNILTATKPWIWLSPPVFRGGSSGIVCSISCANEVLAEFRKGD